MIGNTHNVQLTVVRSIVGASVGGSVVGFCRAEKKLMRE
jgi:hypothetical protein